MVVGEEEDGLGTAGTREGVHFMGLDEWKV
jgi:hypothetical protein